MKKILLAFAFLAVFTGLLGIALELRKMEGRFDAFQKVQNENWDGVNLLFSSADQRLVVLEKKRGGWLWRS